MARYPGKRKSDVVDSTEDHEDRAPKTSRTLEPQSFTTGQRFGESADFIPLNQLSQVAGADEDDAEAADVIPDTQGEAESSLTTNILYGRTLAPNPYFHYESRPSLFFIGTLPTKIVGVRFYNGLATPGEHVV